MKKNVQFISLMVIIGFILLCSFKSALFNYYVTDGIHTYPSWVKNAVYMNVFYITAFLYLLIFRCPFRIVFAVVWGLQTLFLFVNLVYYFYFEGYLHFNQYIELWAETLELMKRSAVPFEPRVLIVFIDLPFVIFLFVFYKKVLILAKTTMYRYLSYLPAFFILHNFSKWDWLKDGTPFETMRSQYVSEVETVRKFGLLSVNMYHLYYYDKYVKLAHQFKYGHVVERTKEQVDSCSQPNNIVIIQIESMDAFSINKLWNNQKVAPHLYDMARKFIYYPYVLSYHKAGSTSDCEFSCLNSVEALDLFPSIKMRNYDYPNALPKRFTKNNFDVAIFHGNRGEYFNRRIAFKKMGFPAFYDIFDMKLKEVIWGAPDHKVLDKVALKIRHNNTTPFYYHTITMSSHEPFIFTEPYFKTDKFNSIPDKLSRNYFTCIAYVDSVVANFVNTVRHQKPNTVFFIFGDHTPAIKDNKYYTQAAYKDNGLYFEYVPLIIITPDSKKYFEKKRAVSFLDIAPTALLSANVPFTISSLGQNLLEPDSLTVSIPYRGVNFSREELFDKANALYEKAYGVLKP
jgi:lipoteichoic acid synthase